jgi:GNAT superfamily N-acetyltransferase
MTDDPRFIFSHTAEVVETLTRYRRAWFSLDGHGAIYLRLGTRAHFGKTLDAASIEVIERYRRGGVFSEALKQCEHVARELGCAVVFAECIHNPVVVDALMRRGYWVTGNAPEWNAFKFVSNGVLNVEQT